MVVRMVAVGFLEMHKKLEKIEKKIDKVGKNLAENINQHRNEE